MLQVFNESTDLNMLYNKVGTNAANMYQKYLKRICF